MKILIANIVFPWMIVLTAGAQIYSIDWHQIAGGGTSSGGVYSLGGIIGQHDAGMASNGIYTVTGGFWSVVAVQTPGAPPLLITRTANNVVLSWPSTVVGYVLENNSNLAATNGWISVSPAPAATNGLNYVTNLISPGNRFYRLRHP